VTVVTSTYRYKRPPLRKKPVPPAVPAVVTIPRKRGRKVAAPLAETDAETAERLAIILRRHENEIRPEAKSAIVTVRRPGRRFPDVPNMTPEKSARNPRRSVNGRMMSASASIRFLAISANLQCHFPRRAT
jgi:hypothetical protein